MSGIIMTILITGIVAIVLVMANKGKYKENPSYNKDYYVMEFNKFLRLLILACCICYAPFPIMNMGIYFGDWPIGTSSGGVVICFLLSFLAMVWLWLYVQVTRIKVEGNDIYYRNFLGQTKQYTFDDIDKVLEKSNRDLLVYSKGKRIFEIHAFYASYYFEARLKENKIVKQPKKELWGSDNPQVVTVPTINHVVGIGSVLVALLVLFIVVVNQEKILGNIVLVSFLVICSVFSVVSQAKWKLLVERDRAILSRFMRKDKTILFLDIKYIKCVEDGNACAVILYSQKGRELKYALNYGNARAMERVRIKYNWKEINKGKKKK